MVRGKFENDNFEKATGIFKEKNGLERVGIEYGKKGRIERGQDLIVKIKAGEQIEHDIEYYVELKKELHVLLLVR